jgi:AcrR family transcriptional regulator
LGATDVDDIVKNYDSGEATQQIGAHFGISKSRVDNRSRRRNGNQLWWSRPGSCSSPRAVAVLGFAEVGRAAGIASAAVHWYFPTKDDLFAAVLERVFGEAIAEVEASDRAPRDRLEAFLSKTQKYRVLHREAYERMEESEALRAAYSGLLQWLEDLLLRAISIRLPEAADTDLIADTAHVLLEGMLISARELDPRRRPDRYGDRRPRRDRRREIGHPLR